MPRERKFYFLPVKELHGREPGEGNGQVSIDCERGYMRFSKRARDIFGGKIIRLYADKNKKAIAWEVFEQGQLIDLKGTHILKVHETHSGKYVSKAIILGVKSALKEIGRYASQNLKETYNQLTFE
mgnify:FL=1